VTVLRTSDNAIVSTIPVEPEPNRIANTPDGSRVYVSNPHRGQVTVIRTSDDTVMEVLDVPFALAGSFPSPMAVLDASKIGLDGPRHPWDLVLMDLGVPGMSGVECTRRIKTAAPELAVVVLTVFEERETILQAICAGADGYLLKRTPAAELLTQLQAVMAGGSPLSAGVARKVLEVVRRIDPDGLADSGAERSPADLTAREREVLGCLVDGMSYKGVASELGISLDTVRTHVRSVYRKLQVNRVAEAVGRALREGLV
jgi:DNA-binding NarL/FixJ family response regulator